MALRIGPFAFLLEQVDDAAYAQVLQDVFKLVVARSGILKQKNVDLEQVAADRVSEAELPALQQHMLELQELHNTLVNLRPEGGLFRLHKALIKLTKSYGYALADYADSSVAIIEGDIPRWRRHQEHGRQWEELACRYLKELQTRWEAINQRDRARLTEMLGSDEFPEPLERLTWSCGGAVGLFGWTIPF